MQYLTTHDLIWINTSITGTAEPYNYVNLEAAMAGQYSYGSSQNVPVQASDLFASLLFKAPFAAGNVRTALMAVATFLNANGYRISASDSDAAAIVKAAAQRQTSAVEAVTSLCAPNDSSATVAVSLRKLISLQFNEHREALTLLANGD